MGIALEDTGSQGLSFGDTTMVCTFAGIPQNDEIIMLVYVQTAASPATRTWPTGFTEKFDISNGGADCWVQMAWKRAASEGGAEYTLTLGDASDNNQGLIGMVYSGAVTSGDPFEAIHAGESGFGTPQTVAAITTLTDLAHHIVIVGANDNMGTPAIAGYNLDVAMPTYVRLGSLTKSITPAGSTGSLSLSGIASSGQNVWTSMALKPAAGGGAQPTDIPYTLAHRVNIAHRVRVVSF